MPQPLAVTAFMASPGRFELPAPRLGGVCSIQLSYGDIFDFSWSRMERSASQDFDDLIIRRRVLYPAELYGRVWYMIIARSKSNCNPLFSFFWGGRCNATLGGERSILLSYGDNIQLSNGFSYSDHPFNSTLLVLFYQTHQGMSSKTPAKIT